MKSPENFDVVVIGGSYSGLASAMALGRSLRKTLVIDSGVPCNRQTPYSHNFITQDGRPPLAIAADARKQVEQYPTVTFINDWADSVMKTPSDFRIETRSGRQFLARKIILATGVKDVMPDIPGFAECWGISVLHCPYCHGYEVRNEKTGILGNGDYAFEFAQLISNWTRDVIVFTNGPSTLTNDQIERLSRHGIRIIEIRVVALKHNAGALANITFADKSSIQLSVLYSRPPFVQHSGIPESLGCELNSDGYIQVDASQKTTVAGVYACGDNATRIRTVANAVAMGTTAGMMVNRELVAENF